MSDTVPAPAPAQAAATKTPDTVTDTRGRVLSLQVINPGQMLDLMESAGSASDNRGWMQFALRIASVSAIDGIPLPVASDKASFRRNADTIGHDGILAVSQALFGAPGSKADEEIQTAKN